MLSVLTEKGILHFEHINVIELFEYFKLPIFILLILEDLLNGDHIQRVLIPALIDDPKRATAHHLLKDILVSRLWRLPLLLFPRLPRLTEHNALFRRLLTVLIEQPLNQTVGVSLLRCSEFGGFLVGFGGEGLDWSRRLLFGFFVVGED